MPAVSAPARLPPALGWNATVMGIAAPGASVKGGMSWLVSTKSFGLAPVKVRLAIVMPAMPVFV